MKKILSFASRKKSGSREIDEGGNGSRRFSLASTTGSSTKSLVIQLIRGGYNIDLNRVDSSFSKLHKGCLLNYNESKIRKYLKSGLDPNKLDNVSRSSPFHLATVNGNLTLVRLLVENGANVNLRDGDGKTPLIKAIESSNQEIVQFLVYQNANPNTADYQTGNTALHWSLSTGFRDAASLILKSCKDVDVNRRNNDNETPLHLACKDRDLESIYSLLIEKGASANATDDRGRTPLIAAVMSNNEAAVKVLLDSGADLNATDENGDTAEAIAKKFKFDELVELFQKRKRENQVVEFGNDTDSEQWPDSENTAEAKVRAYRPVVDEIRKHRTPTTDLDDPVRENSQPDRSAELLKNLPLNKPEIKFEWDSSDSDDRDEPPIIPPATPRPSFTEKQLQLPKSPEQDFQQPVAVATPPTKPIISHIDNVLGKPLSNDEFISQIKSLLDEDVMDNDHLDQLLMQEDHSSDEDERAPKKVTKTAPPMHSLIKDITTTGGEPKTTAEDIRTPLTTARLNWAKSEELVEDEIKPLNLGSTESMVTTSGPVLTPVQEERSSILSPDREDSLKDSEASLNYFKHTALEPLQVPQRVAASPAKAKGHPRVSPEKTVGNFPPESQQVNGNMDLLERSLNELRLSLEQERGEKTLLQTELAMIKERLNHAVENTEKNMMEKLSRERQIISLEAQLKQIEYQKNIIERQMAESNQAHQSSYVVWQETNQERTKLETECAKLEAMLKTLQRENQDLEERIKKGLMENLHKHCDRCDVYEKEINKVMQMVTENQLMVGNSQQSEEIIKKVLNQTENLKQQFEFIEEVLLKHSNQCVEARTKLESDNEWLRKSLSAKDEQLGFKLLELRKTWEDDENRIKKEINSSIGQLNSIVAKLDERAKFNYAEEQKLISNVIRESARVEICSQAENVFGVIRKLIEQIRAELVCFRREIHEKLVRASSTRSVPSDGQEATSEDGSAAATSPKSSRENLFESQILELKSALEKLEDNIQNQELQLLIKSREEFWSTAGSPVRPAYLPLENKPRSAFVQTLLRLQTSPNSQNHQALYGLFNNGATNDNVAGFSGISSFYFAKNNLEKEICCLKGDLGLYANVHK